LFIVGFFYMSGNIEHLAYGEGECQPHQAKDLEVDPGISTFLGIQFKAVVEGDIDIKHSSDNKKNAPGEIDDLPCLLGQRHLLTEKMFYGGSFSDQVASKNNAGKEPINDRRLPLDESVILEVDGETAKYGYHCKGNKMRGLKPTVSEPKCPHLEQGCRYCNRSGSKDPPEFVGREEENQRKKIKKKFHNVVDGKRVV